jgi:hypothetical protein
MGLLFMDRSTWTRLTDAQLLEQCAVDTYRASGPGGQKRNKTSSAVRLRHRPTGMLLIAEESRSQHENKARALKRLRQSLYLHIRNPLTAEGLNRLAELDDYRDARSGERLKLGLKDPRFWPAAGVVLDVLTALEGRVSDAAAALGISTGNLIDFLQSEPKLWQEANGLRAQFGHKPLRSGD